jgi:hypothetical protein
MNWCQLIQCKHLPIKYMSFYRSLFLNFYFYLIYPKCSMYGIFTNICPKTHPNVGKYTIDGSYGYLSIYLSIHPSIYLSFYQSIDLSLTIYLTGDRSCQSDGRSFASSRAVGAGMSWSGLWLWLAVWNGIDLHNLERGLTRYEVNLCNLSEVN